MREFTVGLLIGLFFAAVGAILTALAIKQATNSTLWDAILWGGVALVIFSIANTILFVCFTKWPGTKQLESTIWINLGVCLIIFGLVRHFTYEIERSSDIDYLFYWVQISDPQHINAMLPIYIASKSPATFENVDCWWAPWGSATHANANDPNSPYWSIGHALKVFFPFVRGGAKYGPSISAGDYLVQYDATHKGVNYHFDEHLNIHAVNGSLIQTIEVWRNTVPDGERKLVYSADTSKEPIK